MQNKSNSYQVRSKML